MFAIRDRCERVEKEALLVGYSELQARILAGRLGDVAWNDLRRHVRPSPADMDTPESLPDIGKAASHLADVITSRKPIALVTDHDADGATSHTIVRTALYMFGYPDELLSGYLSHKMTEGYGVSDALVDRMLPAFKPNTCVITADQGSTDEARIARLVAAGHSVVITDHHGLPQEGPPVSALAVVNPLRSDSAFPDRGIAGCQTALLVMAATRQELIERKALSPEAPRLSTLLDYCAVGTVADASSLAHSRNNRLIIQHGLRRMNNEPRPCWTAMRKLLRKEGDWTANDLAFQVATRINARGRLGDAMLGVEFLCATNERDATAFLEELDANNRARRKIETELRDMAVPLAAAQVDQGRYGLCLWLGDTSHAGVHGITASRIVDQFGRPTICLSPIINNPDVVSGSVRTTKTVHVRNALSSILERWPGLLVSCGGHAGAGGLKVRRKDIAELADAWDACVRDCYGMQKPDPRMLVDGDIDSPNIRCVDELAALEPFGRDFEAPLFAGEWTVKRARAIGDRTHLKLQLSRGEEEVEAVWFNSTTEHGPWPVNVGDRRRFAYSLDVSTYSGQQRLQLIIRGIE